MELVQVYQCLCEKTRLRILYLLQHQPLCVCHFQEILQEPQVKISKHLAYLRQHGLVEAERHQHWMIYRRARRLSATLQAQLACLQDCATTESTFRTDLRRLRQLKPNPACGVRVVKRAAACC